MPRILKFECCEPRRLLTTGPIDTPEQTAGMETHEGKHLSSIESSFESLPDGFEPNNDFTSAVEIGESHLVSGATLQPGDEDYFRWTAKKTGMVRIHISVQEGSGDLWHVMYDAEMRDLRIRNSRGTREVVAGETYFIRITGDSPTDVAYQFEIDDTQLPTAILDRLATEPGQPLEIDVTANDEIGDAPLDPASLQVTNGPSHGEVEIDPLTYSIRYTPGTDFRGVDRISYSVADTSGHETEGLVQISVIDPNNLPWQNPLHPIDVSGDDHISPKDYLLGVNYMNSHSNWELKIDYPQGVFPPSYYDTSGDGKLSPIDVLLVVNYFNNFGPGPVEGEAIKQSDTLYNATPNDSLEVPQQPAVFESQTLGATQDGGSSSATHSVHIESATPALTPQLSTRQLSEPRLLPPAQTRTTRSPAAEDEARRALDDYLFGQDGWVQAFVEAG